MRTKKIVTIDFGLNQNKSLYTDESDVPGSAVLPFALSPFHELRDSVVGVFTGLSTLMDRTRK